jgi:hypothetical protein
MVTKKTTKVTATRKRRQKKPQKSQTLAEFRAWLDGVEELQDENWSPNKSQWDLIREKIDNIVINQVVPIQSNTPFVSPPQIPSSIPGGIPPENMNISEDAAKLLKHGTPNAPKKTPEITDDAPFNSPFA